MKETNGNLKLCRLLATLLAFFEITRIGASVAKERTDNRIFVRLRENIVVGFDGPRRGIEFRPIDLRWVSNPQTFLRQVELT